MTFLSESAICFWRKNICAPAVIQRSFASCCSRKKNLYTSSQLPLQFDRYAIKRNMLAGKTLYPVKQVSEWILLIIRNTHAKFGTTADLTCELF